MEKKTPRLQFRDDERSSPAVSRAADRATRAADRADKAKEKLPSRQATRIRDSDGPRKTTGPDSNRNGDSGNTKLKHDSDKAMERQAQLRFGKKEVEEKELMGAKKLHGKAESKLKHNRSASEKAFGHESYSDGASRNSTFGTTAKSPGAEEGSLHSGNGKKVSIKTADSTLMDSSEVKATPKVATSTEDFGTEDPVITDKARAASRKNEAKKSKKADGKKVSAKAKSTTSAETGLKSKLRFSDEAEIIIDPRQKGRALTRGGTATVSGAIHKAVGDSNEDDNVAVNALQTTTEGAEGAARVVDHAGYSKKLKQYDKAAKLERKADKANVDAFIAADKEAHPEKYSNPISRWQQKQKIKKEYATARAAQAEVAYAAEGAGTAGSAGGGASKAGNKLIEKLKQFAVEHNGFIKVFLVLLLLVGLIVTQLQSCSTLLTGSLTTITATSWPSDDKEISKAEAYYVELECKLQKKIYDTEARHPGSAEYNYELDEIGHDPSVLISYLSAKYGGFTFHEVKSEIERIFNLQYKLDIDTHSENKTTTVKVRKGQSLGNVVTSGYCNCSICCGRWAGGATASGVMPRANHTIAVDASTPTVPMGTEIIMNGVLYKVEDTGNFTRYGVDFDVYYDSHSAASAHGHKTWEAFYVGGSGEEVEVTTSGDVNVTTVKLKSKDLETIVNAQMTPQEKEIYDVYQMTHGNRRFFGTPVEYNWHENILGNYGYRYEYVGNKVVSADDMLLSFPEGIKVMSVMDGTVKAVSGNSVSLENEYGYVIKLTGLKNIRVSAGQEVETGDRIGSVSSEQKLVISFTYRGVSFNPYFYMDTGTAVIAAPGIASEKAAALIAEARKYLGTPYVWGGYSPSGFDCSGYVSYCLTHSGVKNTGHLTCSGLLPLCTRISKSQLQPGDLVFFEGTYETTGPSHVGIYIGSGTYGTGTFIHCGDPCQYGNLNSSYFTAHWMTGGRILN